MCSSGLNVPIMVFQTIFLYWLLLFLFSVFPKYFYRYQFRWSYGLAAQLFFILAGFLCTFTITSINYPEHYVHETGDLIYAATVHEPPRETASGRRVLVKVIGVS